MGAPVGNKNATKHKIWSLAIARAVEKRSRVERIEALDALAEKLLEQCDKGDVHALKELGDRLEGKVQQSVTVSGDGSNPVVFTAIEWRVRNAGT